MEIQIIRKELPKNLDKANSCACSFLKVAEDGMIARFHGFRSNPQVSLHFCLLEINGIEYDVAICRLKKVLIETQGDLSKLEGSELVVRKDGDEIYFELA